jgi:hypothetical protein
MLLELKLLPTFHPQHMQSNIMPLGCQNANCRHHKCRHDTLKARFNDPDVTVAGFNYFASLADSFAEECVAQLPRLLPMLQEVCTSSKGLPGHGEDLLGGADDDGDDDDLISGVRAVHTSYIQVKETACDLYLELSNALGAHFLPHAADAFERVGSLRTGSGMQYPSLRQTTGLAVGGLAANIFKHASGIVEWKAGLPPGPGLAANVQTALNASVQTCFELLDDKDRNVVRHGLEALKWVLVRCSFLNQRFHSRGVIGSNDVA